MKMSRCFKRLLTVLVVTALFVPGVYSIPSGGSMPPRFTYRSGMWYDDWGITRNSAIGSDGYLPTLYLETSGENRELAYSIGERFRDQYSDKVSMAKAILKYVQRWTDYGYDSDNVKMNRVSQDEWAWNADEMAHMFNEYTGLVAIGDCEDMAFLCATIYTAAGIDSALVDAPGHIALLIWLPEYPNAGTYWDLPDDGREAGWIWVEATGPTNPLGWAPSDFNDGDWAAYPLGDGDLEPQEPVQSDSDDFEYMDIVFAIVFLVIIILVRSSRR